jgi:hypothetical protein
MTSILFTVLDDQIIVRTGKGIYKQVKVALRGQYAFAKVGGGFVGLYASGTTSHPDIRWIDMENGSCYKPGSLGRLIRLAPGERVTL